MFQPVILSVFEQTGHFSKAYRDAGYEVIMLDVAIDGNDVRLLNFQPGLKIHGLIACPPCTYFSKANSRKNYEENKLTALSLLDVVFRLIVLYQPEWYVIENPSESRIRHYIGEPLQKIKLSDYGYKCLKGTGLWGKFNKIKSAIKPSSRPVKFDHLSKLQRISTPPLLGKMFFLANP